MGYYTNYSLFIKNATEQEEDEIVAILKEVIGDPLDGGNGEYYTYGKWYNHEEDLLKISEQYPKLFFILDGNGEDGDLWRIYVQNGKRQVTQGRVVYEDYDPKKME